MNYLLLMYHEEFRWDKATPERKRAEEQVFIDSCCLMNPKEFSWGSTVLNPVQFG